MRETHRQRFCTSLCSWWGERWLAAGVNWFISLLCLFGLHKPSVQSICRSRQGTAAPMGGGRRHRGVPVLFPRDHQHRPGPSISVTDRHRTVSLVRLYPRSGVPQASGPFGVAVRVFQQPGDLSCLLLSDIISGGHTQLLDFGPSIENDSGQLNFLLRRIATQSSSSKGLGEKPPRQTIKSVAAGWRDQSRRTRTFRRQVVLHFHARSSQL